MKNLSFALIFLCSLSFAKTNHKERVMKLTSTAFTNGGAIPALFTCKGKDISPPLSWDNPPSGTKSFALIADDPDAPVGTWIHWILFNIPADSSKLSENIPKRATLTNGAIHGKNSWGRSDYGGPCPPSGTHRYFFRIYALDIRLTLPAGSTRDALEKAMKGHILAEATLMGRFSR